MPFLLKITNPIESSPTLFLLTLYHNYAIIQQRRVIIIDINELLIVNESTGELLTAEKVAEEYIKLKNLTIQPSNYESARFSALEYLRRLNN